ncbi:NfeD family protein [Natronospora cellulosivora (SeqCode)]
MANWWETIDSFEKFFWYIAIPFSLVFIIQLILTFMGLGDSDGLDISGDGVSDIDIDSGFFGLFTLRNFLTFFTVFAWSGIVYNSYNLSNTLTVILAFLSGFLAMILVAFLFYSMMKLNHSGNVLYKNAVGKKGKVYIPIPAKGEGNGKIQVTFQGALREVAAITEGEALATGTRVVVAEIMDDNTLLVKKIGSD